MPITSNEPARLSSQSSAIFQKRCPCISTGGLAKQRRPQTRLYPLAPTIAPLLLAIGSGSNYTALYLIAGLFFVAGAVLDQAVARLLELILRAQANRQTDYRYDAEAHHQWRARQRRNLRSC